jgi:O-antigen chain-terminating methyltransferase
VAEEQTIDDLLARLERERLAADRLYNDALTAVDRAIQSVPALPEAPPPYNPAQLADLNQTWNILPAGPPAFDRSLKGRLRRFVWRLIGPPLETQQRFNAALVDHLNRNAAAHVDTTRAAAAIIGVIDRELRALVRFESLLIQSLQQITAYVDTKDRSLGGAELRQRLALTEQRVLALKRDVERRQTTEAPRVESSSGAPRDDDGTGRQVDAVTYLAFEDAFRGTREAIRRRVEDYLPLLSVTSDVVDLGCGRGEVLAMLAEHGVRARGVDVNAAMVAACQSRGLDAVQGDALAFLHGQPDASIGGLVAIQVVEHLTPAYLTELLGTAFHKMRPGAPLVLETLNPACWMAFFETYLRDLTHRQALHPDTLKHLVQASGFSDVDVQFRAPVAESDRLDRVDTARLDGTPRPLSDVVAALNAHADKLNRLLFSWMDYVVVARR